MYCTYCKEEIKKGKVYVVDSEKKKYHLECYLKLTTYTDDFGTYSEDEGGSEISDNGEY